MAIDINSLLTAIGGLGGALFLAYMFWMAWYTRKRARDMEELRRDLARIEGLLLGGRRPK